MDKKLIYRVILHVGYNDAYFEFDDATDATTFAGNALKHSTGCDDTKAAQSIRLEIRDPSIMQKDTKDEKLTINDIR